MKTNLILLLIMMATITFRGIAQDSLKHPEYRNEVEHYKRVQHAGKLSTLIGLTSAGTGLAIMAASFWEHGPPGADFPYTLGAGMFVIGSIGTLVGIPVWINGANKKRRSQKKLENITVGINTSQGSAGISITYRFR